MQAASLEAALDIRAADILDRCTACGECVRVCPMPGPAGIGADDPGAIAATAAPARHARSSARRPCMAGVSVSNIRNLLGFR